MPGLWTAATVFQNTHCTLVEVERREIKPIKEGDDLGIWSGHQRSPYSFFMTAMATVMTADSQDLILTYPAKEGSYCTH